MSKMAYSLNYLEVDHYDLRFLKSPHLLGLPSEDQLHIMLFNSRRKLSQNAHKNLDRLGFDGGSVGRAVASDTTDPWFKSSGWQILFSINGT